MTPPLIPPKGSARSSLFYWLLIALAVVGVAVVNNERTASKPQESEAEYSALSSQVLTLESQKLTAKMENDTAKIGEIDKQLASLKPRLAKLEPVHQQFMAEQEVEAKRLADEAEKKRIMEAKKKAAEFQKRCDDARAKRIADLTVNDLQLLRECGVSVQGLPRVP